MDHDPVFTRFKRWSGTLPAGYAVDWNGGYTRGEYANWQVHSEDLPGFQPSLPDFTSEEYLEWVTLLKAAEESHQLARAPFTVIELGAGWGRWIVNAALAAQELGIDYRVIGVEAEPQHFLWMQEHVTDNGLDPGKTTLIEAAVARKDGRVAFQVGTSANWYGQSIARRKLPGIKVSSRPALSLATIIKDLDYVDLIDLDIQGSEFEVLDGAWRELHRKARRLYISTHTIEGEHRIRALLIPQGWYAEHDYSLQGMRVTTYGPISFGDGVQVWRNMNLDPSGRYG